MDKVESNAKFGEWQPIETAPRDGSFVLLVMSGEVGIGGFADVKTHDHGFVMNTGDFWSNPSHWMPLPNPPKG